jgi:hypothetical protein
MDAELQQFEDDLKQLAPRQMPEDLITRMEAAMEQWEESDEKVVQFPAQPSEGSGARGNFLRAVAGVALLGAAIALVIPGGRDEGNPVAGRESAPARVDNVPLIEGVRAADFTPQDGQRRLIDAADQGMIMTHDNLPHRVVRVNSVDHIECTNERGERLLLKVPRVEYLLIPLKTD